MARTKKTKPSTSEGPGELDDLLEPAQRSRSRAPLQTHVGGDDLPLPGGAGPGDEPGDDFAMDGLQQGNRKTAELAAAMQARMSGKPLFPYPPELRDELKPYWLELVNSFPADHFQVSDVPLMRMYCRCAYDVERTSLLIEEEGEVVIGGRGAPMVNPRVKVRGDAQNTIMSLATKFRNQPASRVNTENFAGRNGKAGKARAGAAAVEEGDGLLAGRGLH